ncbi:hypothetical protein NEUTE1DRAFT_118184 [Neurospora tetrasperma FGSC 2508]|uniref:Uncharacterized protein n=1 Tax=Neurospora tetrasperma (strain FGSC 2508 / ATCC MYA-4615 / P0657) TaxID=510951 RepID=F8MXH1_NEUT8|nr:uncharacterized protein NEUTE1DRAFT_118184 [Neurospora tetrasperma FGSC 2508]EGO54442.1 hypothetical protein NEUTE1DRAFT_118184 [Neurospora tetrasperma FGSC 2508]EGZ68108.1 hypothetical protein NEUTE2DRAFT_145849 [Neurospora tetrasperma FGSC 2509]
MDATIIEKSFDSSSALITTKPLNGLLFAGPRRVLAVIPPGSRISSTPICSHIRTFRL